MRNVDSNIKLPDNECYIGPANGDYLPIVSYELTMTEYDPYMKDFKEGMYVQNRAPDNRYYLGTITYNSDLNMAIYKPTDKKGFEQAKLEQDKKDIRTIASFAADWTPADVAIDSASFIAGHDIITGEECNRGILAAGILLPGGLDSLGKGLAKKGVKQAAKHGDDVAEEAFKIGDDVYDVTKGVSKAKFTENLEEHISKVDPTVPRRRGIGGAHNKAEFEKNTVNIVNKVEHPSMKGIEKITYQIPSVDGQTGQMTGWKAKTFDKTIYDPDIISTDKYVSLGKEAANDASSKGQLGREWTGYDSEGNVWRGYTDESGNVTSFFPEL